MRMKHDNDRPWIDISRPIEDGMPVYPGDPETNISTAFDKRDVGGAIVSRISMGSHVGTHIDAPAHFLKDGALTDSIGLDRLIGPATVFSGGGEYPRARRLLLKNAHPMTEAEASAIPEEVFLLGLDVMSVGDGGAHRLLLRRGIVILEGLDLSGVSDGVWELVCLPLRLSLNGAPARAVVRQFGKDDVNA